MRLLKFPPTAKPGVLDEFSKADKWFDNSKIRRHHHFGAFFSYFYGITPHFFIFLGKSNAFLTILRPEFENAINYIVFFVPDAKML